MLSVEIEGWFTCIKECVSTSDNTLEKYLRNPAEDADKRRLAALLLSCSNLIRPDTRMYANAILVSDQTFSHWKSEVGKTIEDIVVRGWRFAAKKQRFALVTPALTVPRILESCNDSSLKGFAKAARVVLSVRGAVKLSIDPVVITELKRLSDSP
jgi:hypothetical protein